MAGRIDRRVIKLEVAFGSDRQAIVIKRDQDLIVNDIMQDIQKVFRIPMEEQVIFHMGKNICDFPNERLEVMAIENNHPIRVNQDSELPQRSPRNILPYNGMPGYVNGQQQLDPISYLKEISPQRVPDPTPYQLQMYNQNMQSNPNPFPAAPQDVLKLYAALGSEREYVLVNGKKPLSIADLKVELCRIFRIAPEQQNIVFKGYALHEYKDNAPLETFGLENNSQIHVWPKSDVHPGHNQVRLPPMGLAAMASPRMANDQMFSPRIPGFNMPSNNRPNNDNVPNEVIKLEIQHGSDRIPVICKGQNGQTLTINDLQQELQKVTSVPIEEQRLYFKSQELQLFPFKTLKESGLENNNTVKLVGDPSKMRYSNYFGRINANQTVDTQFWGNPEFQRNNNIIRTQEMMGQAPITQQQYQAPQQQQSYAALMGGGNNANQSQVFGQAPPSNRF